MKSVLISIQPKWCELIASGEKTVEIRKTRPKLQTPFKVYIYCTKAFEYNKKYSYKTWAWYGKVIGEFVCDRIQEVRQCNSGWVREHACISQDEFFDYLGIPRGTHFGYNKKAYAWHILNLVIYEKPKELSEFRIPCRFDFRKCENCKYDSWDYSYGGGKDRICTVKNRKPITRPPQSWCYVERGASNDIV